MTVRAITVTTDAPVTLRQLTIDNPGPDPGTYEGNYKGVFGTGPADITIEESVILRANVGVLIDNSAPDGGRRARLVVRKAPSADTAPVLRRTAHPAHWTAHSAD